MYVHGVFELIEEEMLARLILSQSANKFEHTYIFHRDPANDLSVFGEDKKIEDLERLKETKVKIINRVKLSLKSRA